MGALASKGSKRASSRDEASSAFGGGRTSAQRLAITQAASEFPGAFTVEQLARAAAAILPGLGTATVYRAVTAMHATGFLERVGEREGSALYVRCKRGAHHHHLVCTGCGAVAQADCPLDEGALQSASRAGYVVTSHEVTIYGLCPACAPKADD